MPARERPVTLGRLKRRVDFLRVRHGRSQRTGSLVLQALKRTNADGDENETARFGFTATKRLGNAVARNRARRRLKETVRLAAGTLVRPGYDYVVIARQGALTQPFARMQKELRCALEDIHREKPARARRTVRPPRD